MKYLFGFLFIMTISSAQINHELRDKANEGDPNAQYTLGEYFYNGIDVDKNYIEAAKWYKSAGYQGHFKALFNLGMMYKEGKGVELNPIESFKLIALVAYYGNDATAQFITGMSYLDGKIVTRNYDEAISWFKKSCENGHQEGCYKYKELNKQPRF